MRKNVELEKLYKDVNIATFIKLQRDIHNDWMMQENTWKIYQATSHKRRQGRPKTRWRTATRVSLSGVAEEEQKLRRFIRCEPNARENRVL
jgi:hypothetical protein